MWETWVRFLGWDDPLEEEIATHSSITAWRIPWTEEPGGSTGSKGFRHDWATSLSLSPYFYNVLSHSVVADSLQSNGLLPTRLLYPWASPGKSTGMGFHFLLQGVFSTQGSNPSLHWQADSLPLHHLGSPFFFFFLEYNKRCFFFFLVFMQVNKFSVYCVENSGRHESVRSRLSYKEKGSRMTWVGLNAVWQNVSEVRVFVRLKLSVILSHTIACFWTPSRLNPKEFIVLKFRKKMEISEVLGYKVLMQLLWCDCPSNEIMIF